MSRWLSLLLCGSVLALGACSSETSADLDQAFEQESVASTSEELGSRDVQSGLQTLQPNAQGAVFLNFPADTLSFSVFATGSSSTRITSMVQPNGSDLFQQLTPNQTDRYGVFAINWGGVAPYVLPMTSSSNPSGGTWSIKFENQQQAYLLTRTGALSANPTLKVYPFLTGTTYSSSALSSALSVFESIYASNGVTVNRQSVQTIYGASYTTVSASFTNSTTSAMVGTSSKADGVNLFFVEDFFSASYLGVAAGIPGVMGVRSSHNGVLISLNAHKVSGSLDSQLLGETIAHEAGHFLGLFHTTESNGYEHDPLSDTPECSSGDLDAEDCIGQGAENLMFWSSWSSSSRAGGKTQEVLSLQQQHVLKASPLAY
jgi:hypothetical protein